MSHIALVAVPLGVVGARLYHVMTDWRRFTDDPLKAFAIWQGGLGIWGAVALGVVRRDLGRSTARLAASDRSPMHALPRFLWRRLSAGSATGSTKSCSASRRPCGGR